MTRAAHRVWSRVAAPMAGLARGEHGAAAIYVAIALPAFVGAGGLAVDVASWYSSKRTIQSGADAAAYAAALELARQGLDQAPNLTTMQAVANDAAGRNGVGVAVTVNFPPLSGPWAGDPQAVGVLLGDRDRLPADGAGRPEHGDLAKGTHPLSVADVRDGSPRRPPSCGAAGAGLPECRP